LASGGDSRPRTTPSTRSTTHAESTAPRVSLHSPHTLLLSSTRHRTTRPHYTTQSPPSRPRHGISHATTLIARLPSGAKLSSTARPRPHETTAVAAFKCHVALTWFCALEAPAVEPSNLSHSDANAILHCIPSTCQRRHLARRQCHHPHHQRRLPASMYRRRGRTSGRIPKRHSRLEGPFLCINNTPDIRDRRGDGDRVDTGFHACNYTTYDFLRHFHLTSRTRR
jgi:hypothetical protein